MRVHTFQLLFLFTQKTKNELQSCRRNNKRYFRSRRFLPNNLNKNISYLRFFKIPYYNLSIIIIQLLKIIHTLIML